MWNKLPRKTPLLLLEAVSSCWGWRHGGRISLDMASAELSETVAVHHHTSTPSHTPMEKTKQTQCFDSWGTNQVPGCNPDILLPSRRHCCLWFFFIICLVIQPCYRTVHPLQLQLYGNAPNIGLVFSLYCWAFQRFDLGWGGNQTSDSSDHLNALNAYTIL